MSHRPERTVTVETLPAGRGLPRTRVPLAETMTLDALLQALDIPGDTEAVIVNGAHARPDYLLQDGDRVTIIPFMSGG